MLMKSLWIYVAIQRVNLLEETIVLCAMKIWQRLFLKSYGRPLNQVKSLLVQLKIKVKMEAIFT